jgi:riboflavin synthase
MFTGIVEEVGKLMHLQARGESLRLTVQTTLVHTDARPGDSIAVNGVCLTVTDMQGTSLSFDVVPVTFRTTGLAALQTGAPVNLERAMAANGRFGGHIVSGHIDTTARIRSIQKEQNAYVVDIQPADVTMLRYMVDKGSIALDGISLTINSIMESKEDTRIRVSIIPHTFEHTVMKFKKPGDLLNVEVDMMAKYAERLLAFTQSTIGEAPRSSKLTPQFLAEHGYMG